MKEPKGRALCPFCGSSDIYYNKHYESWRCGRCEKSFPSPSYGPGGDFGKEARWFGKTTEGVRQKEFAEAARKARTVKFKKSGGSGFSMKKTFLVLLVIACLVAAIYTGYLLFTHQTDPLVGTIILLADIGVLIWNISVLRKYRVGAGTVISILVVIVLLGATISAFAGVEPFSDAKAGVVAWFQKAGSQTPTPQSPPASKYPADIIGYVTIAETVKVKYQRGPHTGETMEMTPLEGQIYWIVDISVKNKSYENAVTGPWKIVVDDKVYDAQRILPGGIQSSYPMTVPMGETGETTIRFPVPETLKVSDARLCYQGQEPYSYGKLTGSDKVAVYDWDLRKVVQEVEVAPELKVADMWGLLSNWSAIIYVQLEATPTTKIGYYDIELQAGKESFVSKRVFWKEGRELMTLDWQIANDTRAWAELSRGKKPIDVFQVEISYEP